MYSIYVLDILFSHKEGNYFICRKMIELYSIILSEIRGKKDKYHMLCLICGSLTSLSSQHTFN